MAETETALLQELLRRIGEPGENGNANIMSSLAVTNIKIDNLSERFAKHEAQDDHRFVEIGKVLYGIGTSNKGLVQQAGEAIDSAKKISDAKIREDAGRADHRALYGASIVGGILGIVAIILQIVWHH